MQSIWGVREPDSRQTDKITLTAVALPDGKMRVTSSSWDEPLVILRGNPYYWIAYVRHAFAKAPEGTDLAALEERCIAVTPLRLDMTDEPYMTKLAELFE